MNKLEIQKIDNSISLVKVTNLIKLTNKILDEKKFYGLILFDATRYYKEIEVENALIYFINKNIWYYLNILVYMVINNKFNMKTIDLDLLDIIIQNDLNYEYPRSFYRKRGNGMPNINKDYDKEIKIKNETYICCSPPIDSNFNKKIIDNINNRILGEILTYYVDTSIGEIIGIKIK